MITFTEYNSVMFGACVCIIHLNGEQIMTQAYNLN